MASRDDFGEKFNRLLREIPAGYSLEQWQHLYRQALFGMGLTILEKFPGDFIGGPGPRPAPPSSGMPSNNPPAWALGGSGGSGIIPGNTKNPDLPDFVRFVLDTYHQPKKKGKRK